MSEVRNLGSAKDDLLSEVKNLSAVNGHLMKVISVANGYDVILRGAIMMRKPYTESNLRHALANILKGIEVFFKARNMLGEYDGGLHSEARILKYILLPIKGFEEYGRYISNTSGVSYYFEVEFDKVKILNKEKIQYAKFDTSDKFSVDVRTSYTGDIYVSLYHVDTLIISKVEIVELEEEELWKDIDLWQSRR
jgi:hypothetical protein